MEPAIGRPEHSARRRTAGAHASVREPVPSWVISPQWSPPWNGGSTGAKLLMVTWEDLPQWSPPVGQREDARRVGGEVRQPVAAMEPAAERREHAAVPST